MPEGFWSPGLESSVSDNGLDPVLLGPFYIADSTLFRHPRGRRKWHFSPFLPDIYCATAGARLEPGPGAGTGCRHGLSLRPLREIRHADPARFLHLGAGYVAGRRRPGGDGPHLRGADPRAAAAGAAQRRLPRADHCGRDPDWRRAGRPPAADRARHLAAGVPHRRRAAPVFHRLRNGVRAAGSAPVEGCRASRRGTRAQHRHLPDGVPAAGRAGCHHGHRAARRPGPWGSRCG